MRPPITKTTQYGPLKNQDYENYFTGPELFAKGGPVYNWIPPNYPRVGARNKQGGWLEKYADGGDVPHDYMYSQGNVSSYRPGTSIHLIGMTNVSDSPCGPGFTIQYDETGNPVCMPIAELVPTAPTAPTPVLAGASQRDYALFNPAVYKQSPLVTYSVERTTRGRNKEERFKPTKEERQATRKAIKASSLHRRPFLSGIGQFFRNIEKCLPGDDCYKFEAGGSIENQKIPDTTAYEFGDKFMAYPDPILTNYQNLSPKSKLPDGKIVDSSPEIPAYAHGATVWTKQTTPSWVAGTPTRTTTQRITPQRAQSPGTQVPYPEIKITGPTNPYMPASPPVLQGYNPYKGPMRLNAPDTRRMAYGGYVPMYKSGGFLRQAGEFAFGALEGTLDTVTGGMTDSLTDMAHDALADAAGTTYDDKAGQRLKRLHGAGKIGGAITGGIVSGNVAGAIGQGAEGTNDILQYSPNASEDLKKWGGFGLNLAQMGSGFMGGANNTSQMASFNASDIGKFAGQAGKVGQGFNMFQSGNPMGIMNMFKSQGLTNNLSGTQDLVSGSNMFMAKHGGRIPGLRWHQLNPGVSAPEGIYTKPTNQRGVTFADGGDTSNSVRESTYVQPVYKDRIIDQDNPVEVANSLLKKYNVKVDSTSNVLEDIGLPSKGYYNPITRTIHYKNPNVLNNLTPEEREYWQTSRYINMIGAEIPHAIQSDSLGVLPFLGKIAYEGIQNPTLSRYDTEGTLEHHAHRILQPELNKKIFNYFTFSPMIERMRRSSVQSSKKKNGGWLDSYDEGGEVTSLVNQALNEARPPASTTSTNAPFVAQALNTAFNQEQDLAKLSDEEFIAKYNEGKNKYQYRTNPQYKTAVDKHVKAVEKSGQPVVKKRVEVNPNMMFMIPSRGYTPETAQALVDENLLTIGTALPIPGLQAVGRLPSVFEVGKGVASKGVSALKRLPTYLDENISILNKKTPKEYLFYDAASDQLIPQKTYLTTPTKLGQAVNSAKSFIRDPKTALEDIKYTQLYKDFKTTNFGKPLKAPFYRLYSTEDLTKKYLDRTLGDVMPVDAPEIGLKEFQEAHKQAIKNLKGLNISKPEYVGLEIRNILANKLTPFANPTVIDDYGNRLLLDKHILWTKSNPRFTAAPSNLENILGAMDYNINRFTPEELNILDAYTRGYDANLNRLYREGMPVSRSDRSTEFLSRYGDLLNNAILKHKIKEPFAIRRGIGRDYSVKLVDEAGNPVGTKLRSELQKGDIFVDDAFISGSYDLDYTWGDRNLSEAIQIPGGSRQSMIVPNASSYPQFWEEKEVILPRGLRRRVIDAVNPNDYNTTFRFMTEILNPYKSGGVVKNKKSSSGWLDNL